MISDLHRHLDGSLRPETLVELAGCAGKEVPHDLLFYPGMGIESALSKFAFTLSLLQTADAVKRIAREICEDAKKDKVEVLEIRFAPHLHQGAALEEIVDAVVDGVHFSSLPTANILLCTLFGDSPDVARRLVDIAKTRQKVVGIDLAGAPYLGCPFRMSDYAPAFQYAEKMGINRTVHAGEGRPADEIVTAIQDLKAQRIGHGTTLLENPIAVDLVLNQNVTVEACLTSNVHVGAIASVQQHPLPRWLKLGVKTCLCTDNTLLSNVSISSEHRLALSIPGMSSNLLNQSIEHGREAKFSR